MLGGGGIDAHAANGVDGHCRRSGLIRVAVLAAAAGLSLSPSAVMMADVRCVCTVCVIPIHVLPIQLATQKFCGRLDLYTLGGYMTPMRTEIKTSCLKRLKRIEGQIRGLAGMVEEDRYCIDVVTQIAAARAALRRVEEEILRDHVAHCVEHAISSGDKADQRRKIAELMDVVSHADR
jgi:DNA-binding FrmR family transcriptional regulator